MEQREPIHVLEKCLPTGGARQSEEITDCRAHQDQPSDPGFRQFNVVAHQTAVSSRGRATERVLESPIVNVSGGSCQDGLAAGAGEGPAARPQSYSDARRSAVSEAACAFSSSAGT